MEKEYEAAEKLKNATDFRLEKEAKVRAEQKKKERELQAAQEAYEKTDVGAIHKNIKIAFEKWNLKGEFEKEVDFVERLQNQSQTAFDGICLEQIKDRIENKDEYYWKKELLPYDAENEFFPVSFKINDISWQSNISIPIDQAETFKNKFNNLRFDISDYDWCFVENSLFPSLITLESRDNDTKYQFPVLIQNQSEISQSFENLEIDNPYLIGYVFKFSKAKAIIERRERERQRLDSLELATFNNRLDSVYRDYNKQLLSNPYNLKQSVLGDYDKITLTSTGSRQDLYDRKVSYMKEEFNRLVKIFVYMRNNEYRQNGKLFATETEFDNFYKNGVDSYQAEIEKRTILNFLSINEKFIETMDFQNEAK